MIAKVILLSLSLCIKELLLNGNTLIGFKIHLAKMLIQNSLEVFILDGNDHDQYVGFFLFGFFLNINSKNFIFTDC